MRTAPLICQCLHIQCAVLPTIAQDLGEIGWRCAREEPAVSCKKQKHRLEKLQQQQPGWWYSPLGSDSQTFSWTPSVFKMTRLEQEVVQFCAKEKHILGGLRYRSVEETGWGCGRRHNRVYSHALVKWCTHMLKPLQRTLWDWPMRIEDIFLVLCKLSRFLPQRTAQNRI